MHFQHPTTAEPCRIPGPDGKQWRKNYVGNTMYCSGPTSNPCISRRYFDRILNPFRVQFLRAVLRTDSVVPLIASNGKHVRHQI